ncbi:MAG: flavodoxin/nitric oxide synthase [Deltaproteobacteria bacterium]|nr:flavodoxin/nitric oxide synthase [Deltaproteobacteria bacterium]
MKIIRGRLIISAILLVVIAAIAAFAFVQIKDRTYFHSPPYTSKQDKTSDVLVVYYSRSGNTEAMAREIARRLHADILRIETKSYGLDFRGWLQANGDSRSETKQVDITPAVVDLHRYRLIFLGSPIWWYRPSPPLWTFVEKNDFSGKDVVLFNTFNSKFKAEPIKEFQREIEKKGGRLIDHIFIRRGRVYYQMNGKELIRQAQNLLDKKVKEWQSLQRSR